MNLLKLLPYDRSLQVLLAVPFLASTASLRAQSWVPVTGDFRVGASWNPASVPGAGGTARISNGGTATLADGPVLEIGLLLLGGDGSGSANRSGSLNITGGLTRISGVDEHSVVGNVAANLNTSDVSVLSMSGGELQFDDPEGLVSGKTGLSLRFDFDGTGSNTWETTGLNNRDLYVGSQGLGQIELHGDAKLFIGDDLGLANNGSGAGQEATLMMDGTSVLGVASGAEVGKVNAKVTITMGGQAVLAAGNSLGSGNPAGQSDEGYFTVGTRDTGNQTINIGDQAELQCMTLQNRFGVTEINLTGEGKLMVHDVFSGSGTILATRPSYLGGFDPCETTVTLRESSLMLVDCLVGTVGAAGPNGVNGLHVGGGDRLQNGLPSVPSTFGSTPGGKATLDVGDAAQLDIKQGLHLGIGNEASADGTLRLIGPDARVTVGGNLNLAYNEYMGVDLAEEGIRPGTGRLEYVLTGSVSNPVVVGGTARISNGSLRLVLDGHRPALGARYILVEAASVEGDFREVDVSGAPLLGDQLWVITNTGTQVVATVSDPASLAPLLVIETNEDSAILTWPGDAQLQVSPDLSSPFVDVAGATSPYEVRRETLRRFYRLRY